jgi:hypothetical protein
MPGSTMSALAVPRADEVGHENAARRTRARNLALFARYLFTELDSNSTAKSWSPIRSTLGVSRLLTFGDEPAKVPTHLIE